LDSGLSKFSFWQILCLIQRLLKIGQQIIHVLEPTDNRTRPGSTAICEPAVERCVIAAGTSISDSTPPNDSASVKIFVLSATRTAASRPAFMIKEIIPPPFIICPEAILCCGWLG
jgi:hypothetical protein